MGRLPSVVLWEITYACPLRCSHCYSESGVRPSRQLPLPDMLRLADVLVAIRPRIVHISGGEPVIVKGLTTVIERLVAGGVSVVVTTSGFGLTAPLARELAAGVHSFHVSVDGPDAGIHDRIRGRAGSFDAALEALHHLDALSAERRRAGGRPLRFGIDCVVLRSNFEHLPSLLRDVASRFSQIEFVILNGVVPQGLASRPGYEEELLTNEQARQLADPAFSRALEAHLPAGVVLQLRDNLDLAMRTDRVREGIDWTLDRLIVEPDGQVRGLEIYEGHVGNLLHEPAEVVWDRVCARREHPFVIEQLAHVRSSHDWAAAARRIDQYFASPDDLVRIGRRKPYAPA